jgi:ribosome-binding factor A
MGRLMAKNHSSEGAGPSQRQLRVGEVIRRALSDVLNRGSVHDPELQRLSITVGEVRCSTDLRYATAYVLPLGGQDKEACLKLLRKNTVEIRYQVVKGMTLRFAPELRFELDDTFDRIDETRRLFSEEKIRRDIEE